MITYFVKNCAEFFSLCDRLNLNKYDFKLEPYFGDSGPTTAIHRVELITICMEDWGLRG